MKDMKNKLLVFLILLVLVFSSLVFPTSKAFSHETKRSFSIVVEPKIELLGIISLLEADDYFACELFNTIFKRDAVAWFRPYKNHPAIQGFRKLLDMGFSENDLRHYLLEIGDLPELAIPDSLSNSRWKEEFKPWQQELVDFLNVTNFSTYWSKEKEYYQQAIDQFIPSSLAEENIKEQLRFFGLTDLPFRWILSPLIFENQAILLNQEKESQGMIILGLTDIQNGRLLFGNEKNVLSIVSHDLLKLLIEGSTKPFQPEIQQSASLLEPIREAMEREGVYSWQECFNQHLFFSIQLIFDQEDTDTTIKELNDLGYIYLEDTFQLLKQYNQYRDYFPTVSSFLPRIIQQFENMARGK